MGCLFWRRQGLEGGAEPVIKTPVAMANKTFSEALNENIKWTPELVAEMQELLVKSDHVSICSGKGPGAEGPPPPPPQGFKNGKGDREQLRRGPPGPPQGFEKNGPPPSLPPELEEMLKVNYPKLEREYSPPQTCSGDDNSIELWMWMGRKLGKLVIMENNVIFK